MFIKAADNIIRVTPLGKNRAFSLFTVAERALVISSPVAIYSLLHVSTMLGIQFMLVVTGFTNKYVTVVFGIPRPANQRQLDVDLFKIVLVWSARMYCGDKTFINWDILKFDNLQKLYKTTQVAV